MFPHLSAEAIVSLLQPVTLPAATLYSNWSQTYQCVPTAMFVPESELQCELILELARRRRVTVRATGVGHSPNDVACSTGYIVRTLKLDALLEVCLVF
jgi:L-gulonolactone oxidase